MTAKPTATPPPTKTRAERAEERRQAGIASAERSEALAAARKRKLIITAELATAIDAQRTCMRDGRFDDAAEYAMAAIAVCATHGVNVGPAMNRMRALLATVDAAEGARATDPSGLGDGNG